MAVKRSKRKQKHIMLRKLMAGLMLTCFLIFVLGQISRGVSAKSMLTWSSVLIIFLGIVFQVLLKLWSSWEDVSERPSGTNKGNTN